MFEETLNNLIKEHFGTAIIVIIIAVLLLIFAVWRIAIIHFKIKKIESLPCEDHTEQLKTIARATAKLDMLPCGSHSEQLKKLTELSAKLDERLKSQPCISNSEQLNKLTELSAKFDTKLESLPCGSHKQDLADHDKAVTRISTTLQYLEKTLEGLQKQNKTQIYTLSHSPLRITDAGREMMEKLGIQAMFDANWPRVKRFIDEMGNKNPYDIDQFCIQQAVVFPEKFLQADELDKIKIDAYKTGDTLMSYMKVFAVLARDRYFEENGINVAEEDYTPDPYCNNITRTQ